MSPSGSSRNHGSTHERPHVLLVSEDADLRAFLEESLVLGGFWISHVGSAIQTLEVLRLRGFDLVLIDAALGGMGAIELVNRLRGRSDRAAGHIPRTDAPILVIAANANEIDQLSAAASGVDRVLYAPLDAVELTRDLFQRVSDWRAQHPGRPWSDHVGP